jgi:hypothetical protein
VNDDGFLTPLFAFIRCGVLLRDSRIIEIEWSVKNDKPFIPSPQRARKPRSRVKSKSKYPKSAKKARAKPAGPDGAITEDEDENMADDSGATVEQTGCAVNEKGKGRLRVADEGFGMEVTNSVITPTKRSVEDVDGEADEENMGARAKRQRKKHNKEPTRQSKGQKAVCAA